MLLTLASVVGLKLNLCLLGQHAFAIQRLSEEDKKKLLLNNGSRIFGILESLITSSGLPDNIWYAAAEKAIGAVYMIHPTPETLAADLVKKSLSSVSNWYTLNLVFGRSRNRKVEKKKWMLKDNSINAELGLAASEDAVIDALAEKTEKEIVSGGSSEKNLIGECAPFLSKLCRNFSLMQKYPVLQASAMLALCRFMIIDANYCDANLQLLFTVVENASSEIVRSNCTIALGDLAFSVRKNAVLVLSHLILNDMMKVKGYINEMAVCVEDHDERIANLAKLFFHELSKKGSNPIYNLLPVPDILGKLSTQDLKKESFCNIMQFLIGSLKKDKQMESLVEKLCNRFSGVTGIGFSVIFCFLVQFKQMLGNGEHISYCLSQLQFTEKGMKKLIESFKTYEHALSEDTVMDHFRNIVSKAKKFAKPELKACIEEFEEKLNKFHMDKKEQEVTARNAEIHRQKIGNIEGFPMAGSDGESVESDVIEGLWKIGLTYFVVCT
ncbi:Armadillo-like helical [Corchorus olitorius]|uniref:Armadillo-like helical n=1 Tax=Corchorus olitorius TaxID=93759 RepID=A0A1R3FXU4_9ROSI|nr:Armadillo-like helical [Corchorus olitorius]